MRPSILAMLCLALLLATPAAAQDATELQHKADAALSQNDWRGAVPLLEALIAKSPGNEQAFWDLTKLCDAYGLDHEKAVTYYRLYAERFPNGRFSARFKDRLAYLEAHRQDWGALKELAAIQTEFHGKPSESLAAAERLASTPLSASASAEVSNWLAAQFLKTGELRKARAYAERLVATFPDNGKGRTAHVQALLLCSRIASKQHDYGAATRLLRQVESVDPHHAAGLQGELQDLRFHAWAQRAFFACAGFAALVIAGVVASRPWKRKRLGLRPGLTAILCAAVVALSALPGGLLLMRGERVPTTFWALGGAGCLTVVVLQVATAALERIGRVAWAALGILFAGAMVYSAIYLTDTAKVLDWSAPAQRR